jgi:erythromycin esterase-like protein
MPPTDDVMGALTATGRPLVGASDDYDYFFELIGDARLVLLGEATHGTHEFYRERRSRNG